MSEKEKYLTQDQLQRLLVYEPSTGIFRRRVPTRRLAAGAAAGTTSKKGYRVIVVNQKPYYAHRLAWLHAYGAWPAAEIDHINGIKTDNRLSNLREATRTQNNRNSRLKASNTSGFKGVHFQKKDRIWVAYITVNKARRHLGVYQTREAAAAVYRAAASAAFGEFAKEA